MANNKLAKFWSLPVRLHHWVHVALLMALIVTGLYIYYPFVGSGTATMSTMLFIHYVAMYLFVADLVIRFYMAVFSRRKSSTWRVWLPSQTIAYSGWAVVIIIQAFLGFILYFSPTSPLWSSYGEMLGGLVMVRLLHVAIMWFFIVSVLGHIYIAFMHSMVERSRAFRSMISGNRPVDFVEEKLGE